MQITTVMVVIVPDLVPADAAASAGRRRSRRRRFPATCISATRPGLVQGHDLAARSALVAIIIAFGHSLLSMSGFETLAQVYREIASPKLKNLKITGNIVCIYAVLCTGVITLFAGMIIPDAIRHEYVDNLLGGLAMHLAGPELLRLVFHVFVVIVGVLILSGAVNTSMIGANGVMNRVAEDRRAGGLVPQAAQAFRHDLPPDQPDHAAATGDHRAQPRRCLSARRSLRLRRGLELLPEIAGRAGAALQAPRPGVQDPGQFPYRRARNSRGADPDHHSILGPGRDRQSLSRSRSPPFTVCSFTVALFVVFTVSERINKKKIERRRPGLEEFNLEHAAGCSRERRACAAGLHPGGGSRLHRMSHLLSVLEKTNLRRHDIVVMTVRPVSTGAGEYDLADHQLFSDYERELFTRVVSMAEKEGKTVDLLVVPGVDPFDAMVQTAAKLKASRLVTGVSARMDSDELARRIGLAWEKLARAAASLLARDHHPGPAFRLCQSGTASAALVAGGSRPYA